jgi:chromosome segregation ATPase
MSWEPTDYYTDALAKQLATAKAETEKLRRMLHAVCAHIVYATSEMLDQETAEYWEAFTKAEAAQKAAEEARLAAEIEATRARFQKEREGLARRLKVVDEKLATLAPKPTSANQPLCSPSTADCKVYAEHD